MHQTTANYSQTNALEDSHALLLLSSLHSQYSRFPSVVVVDSYLFNETYMLSGLMMNKLNWADIKQSDNNHMK